MSCKTRKLDSLKIQIAPEGKKMKIEGREWVVYEITAKGKDVLAEGFKRWVEFTEGARRLLTT